MLAGKTVGAVFDLTVEIGPANQREAIRGNGHIDNSHAEKKPVATTGKTRVSCGAAPAVI